MNSSSPTVYSSQIPGRVRRSGRVSPFSGSGKRLLVHSSDLIGRTSVGTSKQAVNPGPVNASPSRDESGRVALAECLDRADVAARIRHGGAGPPWN
jgi:hypothetical protein